MPPARRRPKPGGGAKSRGAFLKELDGVADRDDGFGGVIRDLDVEFLLERHHELDGVEAVGAEIVDEVGVLGHLVGLYAEVLDNDFLHTLSDITHVQPSYHTSLEIRRR